MTSFDVQYYDIGSAQIEKVKDENGTEKSCVDFIVQEDSTSFRHCIDLKFIMKTEQHTLEFHNFLENTLKQLWSRGSILKTKKFDLVFLFIFTILKSRTL